MSRRPRSELPIGITGKVGDAPAPILAGLETNPVRGFGGGPGLHLKSLPCSSPDSCRLGALWVAAGSSSTGHGCVANPVHRLQPLFVAWTLRASGCGIGAVPISLYDARMSPLRRYFDLALLSALGALLVAFPALDLETSALFYDPADGFRLKTHPLARFIYELVPWISRITLGGLILFLLGGWIFFRRHARFITRRRVATYLLLVALVGPLLLVNGVFKEHWGRARPSQVVEFGGTKAFTRAAIPTDQCARNCSFVSGHASVGFYFLALAFVWPRRRMLWLGIGTVAGVLVGLVRIVQGGHFLSDVVFAGIVVYLTARGLAALMHPADVESRA